MFYRVVFWCIVSRVRDSERDDIFSILDDFSDPRNRCFLCGTDLSVVGKTDEHVVPRWVQRRYDLWSQKLTLLNGTAIPYSQLTVPCCSSCNNDHLSRIEDSLSATVDRGRSAVVALGPKLLFLWLGKIFYAILYKELMLLRERADPYAGTIISEDFIRQYRSHRLLLQQARGILALDGFQPGSLFVFEAQPIPHSDQTWDLTDHVHGMAIGVRIGRVCLIAALGDGAAQQKFDAAFYEQYYDLPLHPIQFRELFARVAYRSTLATRVPKYITGPDGHGGLTTFQLPLGGLSDKPAFEDWIPFNYARVLAAYTAVPLEQVYEPPDLVRTWLHSSPSGPPLFLPYKS